MDRETLRAIIVPIADELLRSPPAAQNPSLRGLSIERVGIGEQDTGLTIDVFVASQPGEDPTRLGAIAQLLQRLPTDLWQRVRVLDAHGRAALLPPVEVGQ